VAPVRDCGVELALAHSRTPTESTAAWVLGMVCPVGAANTNRRPVSDRSVAVSWPASRPPMVAAVASVARASCCGAPEPPSQAQPVTVTVPAPVGQVVTARSVIAVSMPTLPAAGLTEGSAPPHSTVRVLAGSAVRVAVTVARLVGDSPPVVTPER
jgi:hypothetical protein